MRSAPFGRRAVAFVVDIAVLTIVERLLRIPAGDGFAIFAVNTLYFFLGFVLLRGQTPGKKLLGITVVGRDGRPPTVGIAFLRAAFYAVEGLLLGLGFLLALGSEGKALHDWVLGTRVVPVGEVSKPADIVEPDVGETAAGGPPEAP